MTRRSDLMCEDIFGCAHEPETPVTENGEVAYWLCRCGEKKTFVKEGKDTMNEALVEAAARAAHEVNRVYCLALGDASQPPWEEAPDWQKDSARNGARLHLSGEHSAYASHKAWFDEKQAAGWTWGPVKDPEKKEHPCMVPFDNLPREQQAKDSLFKTVVEQVKLVWDAGVGEGVFSR